MDNTLNVICPKCEHQESYLCKNVKNNLAHCSQCSTSFHFLYAIIRAKKSRGNKQLRTRIFDIRIILSNGEEDFIQFERDEYDDIELRSKDIVVFIYQNDKLRIINNVTINLYTVLKEKSFWEQLGSGPIKFICGSSDSADSIVV